MVARTKKSRINLRIPTDLVKWMKKYAKERNTTLTQLVVLHFMNTKSGELLRPDHNPFEHYDKTFNKEASHG